MKLFIIFTLLLALILAIQFYIGYRTQKDLISELQKISSGINRAVDAHYADVLKQIRETDTLVVPSMRISIDTKKIPKIIPEIPESLYVEVAEALKNVDKIKVFADEKRLELSKKYSDYSDPQWQHKLENVQKMVHDMDMKKMRLDTEQEKLLKQVEKKISVLEEYLGDHPERQILTEDSAAVNHFIRIENIDVPVNKLPETAEQAVFLKTRDSSLSAPASKMEEFTIRIPDFSLPDKPKVIHYNLQAAQMEKTVQAAIQKNIMLTLGLFVLSIVAVLLISRKFLQPIGHLKNSFARVVDGQMDIQIPVSSRDEIGDLTNSFNHMVLELRKNKEKEKLLQQKERLASMGQLAAGVAHEIKNPLNAIHLTIDHLKDKYPAADKTVQKYILTIQNEINRLDKLVDNFLNFVRSEHLEKRMMDIRDLISSVLNLLHKQIESQHIEVETDLEAPLKAEIDPERFKTVLLNIMLNAIQAIPEGGVLKLTSRSDERQLIIEDSGPGIPARDLDKIFDLFYTTKSKGTGLGLPTAYKIVKEHGGELTVQSEQGRGTRVMIYFK
jgi:signal transduction histidine kinase